jgi:hypothetical protein
MQIPNHLQTDFEASLCSLMNKWCVWAGDDLIRAIQIGFDSCNTEICVSILTDREPYLQESGIDPFGQRWPTADWRLTDIASTYKDRFPDAKDLMQWMRQNCEPSEGSVADEFEYSYAFNQMVKRYFAQVLSGPKFAEAVQRFRNVAPDIRLRVEWYFDQDDPIDCTLSDA